MDSWESYGAGDEHGGMVAVIAVAQMGVVPACLNAVITLGVPNILCDAGLNAKLTAQEIASLIASSTGGCADAENLGRLLRVLAKNNIVKEYNSPSPHDPQICETRYGPTFALQYLRNDDDGFSLSPLVRMINESVLLATLPYLHASVLERNAEPYVVAHGKKLWQTIETDPRLGKMFHKAMAHFTHIWMSQMLQKYKSFEGVSTLVDVGGGLGACLAMILSAYPHVRGINFDLPEVVVKGLQLPRMEHVGGSFFEHVPAGDAIWMKWILHDWDDESCIKILKNVAKALPPHGKLINVDAVLPESSSSSLQTKTTLGMDVWMMAINSGGKERTLSDFRRLGAAAGFARVEVVAMVEHLSLLEFYK